MSEGKIKSKKYPVETSVTQPEVTPEFVRDEAGGFFSCQKTVAEMASKKRKKKEVE